MNADRDEPLTTVTLFTEAMQYKRSPKSMKALALVALSALASVTSSIVLAECGPSVPGSGNYGYQSLAGPCKTLEEAEAEMRAVVLPTMEYAFLLPNNFAEPNSAAGMQLDYRPYAALSTSSPILQQPVNLLSSSYKIYTKGWPPSSVHANCAAVASACPTGLCPSMEALAAFVKCQFDNTWNLNATSVRPAFCWVRQGEPTTTNVFGTPSVLGTGQTGSLLYTPASSTSASWGAKISITAQTCDGGPALIDPNGEASTAASSQDWNIDRRDEISCPDGSTVGGASSAGGSCNSPFFKVLIGANNFTQTPATCGGEGNPCFPSNGNKQVDEEGFQYGGIDLNLHYNSMRQTRPFSYIDRNWSHSFAKRIFTEWAAPGHLSSADTLPIAQVSVIYYQNERAELEVFRQRQPLVGLFQSTESTGILIQYIPAVVGVTPPRWELSRGNGVREIYDRAGRLAQIIDPNPVKTLALTYMLNELTPGSIPTGNGNHNTEPFWRIDRVTDGSGRYAQFEYSGVPFYWLTRIVSGSGETLLTLGYDSAHRLTSLRFADNTTPRQFVYNEPANIFVGGMVPSGIVGYWLTGIIDERGQRYATYRYDDWGRAISSWHGANHGRVDVDYVNDQSAIVTYALGNTKTISYNPSEPYRHKQSETDQDGTRLYQYDPVTHRLTQVQDALGNVTKLQYDANNARVTKRTEAFGTTQQRRIETDWDTVTSQMLARRIYRDPTNTGIGTLEAQTTYTYDATSRNLLTRTETDPLNGTARTWTHAYCSAADVTNHAVTGCAVAGQLRQIDGPRADVTDIVKYTYRAVSDTGCASNGVCNFRQRDLWKSTNALNHVIEYVSYDSAGRVKRIKDANLVLTDLTYHARGWLQTSTVRADANGVPNAGDATTTIAYDAAGLITRITQPDGAYIDYTYDAAQRLTRIADNQIAGNPGNSITYTLDAAGNRLAENTRDPGNVLTRKLGRVYNTLGRLHKILNAQNAETVFSYDANGNQDTVADALSRVTDSDVDPLNRLMRTTDALLGQTEYRYDARDNLTEVVDAKELSTLYSYNGFGDLKQLTSPDTGVTQYTYDSAGNRATQTDARSVISTYGHDALNRLNSISYPIASNNLTFTYDQNHAQCASDELFGKGRLTGFTDPSGNTKLCYDRRGNLKRKIAVVNGVTLTTRWSYSLADHVTQLVYPSGSIANYTRDTLGRISAISVTPSGGTPQSLISAVGYYPFGPVKQLTWANNTSMLRSYDQNYWISSISTTPSSGPPLNFTLDAVGNVLQLSHPGIPKPTVHNYGYDPLYRLTSSLWPAGHGQAYEYDAIGNRTSKTIIPAGDGPMQFFLYDYLAGSHRLDAINDIGRSYDPNGNTLKRDRDSATEPVFTYDQRNRYSSVSWPGGLVSYHYNAGGERVFKNVNSLSTASRSFAYGLSGNLLMEGNANGTALQEYIWLDNLPVGVVAGGQLHHIQPDHLGTPRKIVQSSNNLVIWDWAILDNPFGENQPDPDPDGNEVSFIMNLRFPGQYYDVETGLHYNYFRDYEPGTGRYVESDPIGLRAGMNSYTYVGGNPLRLIDFLGLTQCDIDFALRFARENVTDQTIPDLVHTRADLDDAIGRTWHPNDPANLTPGDFYVAVSTDFLGELDGGMQNLLLETIIHEGQHIDEPDRLWRLPKDHPDRVSSHRQIRQSALDKINALRDRYRLERANSEDSSCQCQ
jgi:RHS repeat-associated protein